MISIVVIPGVPSKAGAVSGAAPSDVATATWNGVTFTTSSAHGACMALARELVAAGCPDQPWQTTDEDGKRSLHGPSLHGLARLTIKGDRFARWRPYPEKRPDMGRGGLILVTG